jgi:ABC-type multidrug transport system permease subunit
MLFSLEVIWACLKKELQSIRSERAFLFQTLILPLNYNLLLILFALSGSNAPTAVVLEDSGVYAQAIFGALAQAHSFHLQIASSSAAQRLIESGEIVAVVTVPSDFDAAISAHQPAQLGLLVNNLNTDLTADVRRGVRLAITDFGREVFPKEVTIAPVEQDAYRSEVDYIQFLSVSILVIGLMVAGLLQAGTVSAREWERNTIKELQLSPAPGWAMAVGKMLAAWLLSLVSGAVVLAFVTLVIGDWPKHWATMLVVTMLIAAIFVALGTGLGTWLRSRQTLTLLTRGSSVPLFFLSGLFAPITFSTLGVQVLARLFPVHYAIVLEQYSFFNFQTNTLGLAGNLLILLGFLGLGLVLTSVLVTQRAVR